MQITPWTFWEPCGKLRFNFLIHGHFFLPSWSFFFFCLFQSTSAWKTCTTVMLMVFVPTLLDHSTAHVIRDSEGTEPPAKTVRMTPWLSFFLLCAQGTLVFLKQLLLLFIAASIIFFHCPSPPCDLPINWRSTVSEACTVCRTATWFPDNYSFEVANLQWKMRCRGC